VTDANVCLGLIAPGPIADGSISIDAPRAEEAVRGVAEPLGLSVIEAARGIHQLANARMMRALRAVSSEKGRNPRDFALVAYGGSGPVHAAGLADELGVRTVLVPAFAGLFSALGLLFARPEAHEVRTCQLDARAPDLDSMGAEYADMERRLAPVIGQHGETEWLRTADLRYKGQSWEVEAAFGSWPLTPQVVEGLIARFEAEYERLYGVRGEPDSPIEIRALRLAALGPPPTVDAFDPEREVSTRRPGTRLVHFANSSEETPAVGRTEVTAEPQAGPLLVDEYDTVVVVPPDWAVHRDEDTATLVLEREEGA
jgi:N-methylhydantoinase A